MFRVDAQPLLRPLLRNWAKGQRLAFLEGFISDYKEGVLTKKSSSVLDVIINQWFNRFHWSTPLSADDTATPTVFLLDSHGHEILGSADSILKGRVIERARTVCELSILSEMRHAKVYSLKSLYHWYEYRCKRTTLLLPRPSKGKKDHVSLLVEKFLGRSTSSSRRSAGWEVWGKEHFPSMKADFEAEFAASGRHKSARASARNDFKLARWKELDDDTQERWNETAKTNHATTQKATQDRMQNSGRLDPAEAQA